MADLLLELFSEEIPARMQAKAEADLGGALEKALKDAGLGYAGLTTASGPRRLAVSVTGLDTRSADVKEERKGPKVGAPEKALEGFMRGAGLTDISQAQIKTDPKKGEFYVAVMETPGRDAVDVIAEAVPAIVRGFHWAKSMRWGTGDLRWVRPLQRIVCVLDGAVVPFDIEGIAAGNQTEGHRVHGRGPFTVTGWDDYASQLEGDGHVMLTRDARRETIMAGITKVCADNGLEWVEDKGLLEEVTGLAEWPVVILGDMDPLFLELPPEVIQLSMRVHQKYFAVRDKKTGNLAPNFIVVANIDATDGGKTIAQGNARVLSARLEDGRFFYKTDTDSSLEEMGKKLSTIAFKEELGSLGDKVERVAALARELAPKVGADPDLAEQAARLCKADLVSEMVGEFPELQGVMGRYYALEAGRQSGVIPDAKRSGTQASEAAGSRTDASAFSGMTENWTKGLSEPDVNAVADAIRDHYKPQGPGDATPTEPVSIAVALADKLDTLVGFWAIDEKPTGSKDPFALRRATLGAIGKITGSVIQISLSEVFAKVSSLYIEQWKSKGNLLVLAQKEGRFERVVSMHEIDDDVWEQADVIEVLKVDDPAQAIASGKAEVSEEEGKPPIGEEIVRALNPSIVSSGLLSFFVDRLKQVLRDQGQRHDLIDAVFALGEDDLVLITRRVEALGAFLESDDGATLLEGYKRAANILRAEEKKGALPESLSVDPALIAKGPAEEQALHAALTKARAAVAPALEAEEFAKAMGELAGLRTPVYAFFDSVMVNDDDAAVRANRLALLEEVRSTLSQVADFSKIEG